MNHPQQPRDKQSPHAAGPVAPAEVLSLLWDAVPLGICHLAPDQTILFANRTTARLLRRSSADCVGKTLPELIGQRLDLSDSLRSTGI